MAWLARWIGPTGDCFAGEIYSWPAKGLPVVATMADGTTAHVAVPPDFGFGQPVGRGDWIVIDASTGATSFVTAHDFSAKFRKPA